MELYLQIGYGMMGLSRDLIGDWRGGTVILSPRDLGGPQLIRHSRLINNLPNGRVMVDPQFYLPHADHTGLTAHDFWPVNYSTGSFFGGPALSKLVADIKKLNNDLGTSMAILPGLLAQAIDSDWLAAQDAILQEARNADFDQPLCQTIALSSDACRVETQVLQLLEHVERVKADAYYLVCEHPGGNYLVDDPTWLSNLIDIVAGLRLSGGQVIVGYCSHQVLIGAVAKANAIASGTWLNVRSFPPSKFQNTDDTKRKAVWYYAPACLSEYKLAYLDIARRVGVLNLLAPPPGSEPAALALFSGGQPSAIDLSEPQAFRHYLTSLKRQVDDSEKESFDATVAAHESLLDEAQTRLAALRSNGITGLLRDFEDSIAANRAALASINATRGAMLRREWRSL